MFPLHDGKCCINNWDNTQYWKKISGCCYFNSYCNKKAVVKLEVQGEDGMYMYIINHSEPLTYLYFTKIWRSETKQHYSSYVKRRLDLRELNDFNFCISVFQSRLHFIQSIDYFLKDCDVHIIKLSPFLRETISKSFYVQKWTELHCYTQSTFWKQ